MTEWKWDGARWWKFDFHTHTPASTGDYGRGPDKEKLMKLTPREWLLDYMRAGIDCVAITDHNTGEWIDPLKDALAELKGEKPDGFRPLHIFPGMEISVNAGIHLLAIFDDSKTSADITELRGALDYTGAPDADKMITQKPINKVVEEIHNRDGIAIPAHADKENGLFSEQTGLTLEQALRSEDILAMELIDPAFPKPQLYLDNKVNWTQLVGSDAHHPSGSGEQKYPGSRFTWVKMGEPCLEGLRLALLDGQLSVRRSDQETGDPNEHSTVVLVSIEISKACYMGRDKPFTVPLNPWLNAIIGGRGTGKSTLVEFLRIALRRTGELDRLPEDIKKSFKKYSKVYSSIDRTLDDKGLLTESSHFTVVYRKDGLRYRIQWNQAGTAAPIEVEKDTNAWRTAQGDIVQRFPIHIYSQKQIYALADNPLGLLRIVDEAPEVDRRRWQKEWHELEARFLSLRAKAREIALGLAEEGSLRGELEDVKRKLAVFERAGHAQVLKDYQRRLMQHGAVEKWEETWLATGGRIRDLARDLAPAPLDDQSLVREDPIDSSILKASAASAGQIAGIAQKLEIIAEDADSVAERWRRQKEQSEWHQALALAIEAHKELVSKLAQDGIDDPYVYGELVQQTQSIESELKAFDDRRGEAQSLKGQADACLAQLAEMRRELTKKRAHFLSQTLMRNKYVRIEVLPYQARETVEEEFRGIIQREDRRFKDDIDKLLANLYSEDPDATELERRLLDLKREVRDIAEGRTDPGTLQDKRFATHLAKLAPESLDRLDLWFPEDSLKVEHSREADGLGFSSIDQGSPGQKAAALLAFLLSYGEEPMVLDQPEDDLDNHVIYDLIVEQLRQNKRRRQVIVVTHNANIVVNGDAELVMALKAAGGQTHLECIGILQEENVRNTICAVMEGGKAAFERRYRRITLEGRHV